MRRLTRSRGAPIGCTFAMDRARPHLHRRPPPLLAPTGSELRRRIRWQLEVQHVYLVHVQKP